tara:strand:+ start:88 stop:264 length:177 start_codon:yes stop_codon:yes gene_type:complete
MSKLSKELHIFWDNQINNGSVIAKPFSGNCMFCGNNLKQSDSDHSVCNSCWENIAEEE